MVEDDAVVVAMDETVLTNHRVVRDGGVWLCLRCGRTEPFGALTDWGETCLPRRWDDRDG